MLPCATQSIRIRDGKDVWMSELIGEYTGRGVQYSGPVISSGNLVLIDFHLNDSQIVNNACYAGFIGHVELIGEFFINLTLAWSFILKCFRAAKCYNHRRVVNHENCQGQNDCAIKSHAFHCVPVLRDYSFDQRFSGRAIYFSLPSLPAGQEQGRS